MARAQWGSGCKWENRAGGKHLIIGTSLGHQFVIVDGEQETKVVSQARVQGFRYDPAAKDGVPTFYTRRASAGGLLSRRNLLVLYQLRGPAPRVGSRFSIFKIRPSQEFLRMQTKAC